jgi:hypothetical protein
LYQFFADFGTPVLPVDILEKMEKNKANPCFFPNLDDIEEAEMELQTAVVRFISVYQVRFREGGEMSREFDYYFY